MLPQKRLSAITYLYILILFSVSFAEQPTSNSLFLDFSTCGVAPDKTEQISSTVKTMLLASGRYTPVNDTIVREKLSAEQFSDTACSSPECLTSIGNAAGVRFVAKGIISQVEEITMLHFQLIDVTDDKNSRTYSAVFDDANGTSLMLQCQKAVDTLCSHSPSLPVPHKQAISSSRKAAADPFDLFNELNRPLAAINPQTCLTLLTGTPPETINDILHSYPWYRERSASDNEMLSAALCRSGDNFLQSLITRYQLDRQLVRNHKTAEKIRKQLKKADGIFSKAQKMNVPVITGYARYQRCVIRHKLALIEWSVEPPGNESQQIAARIRQCSKISSYCSEIQNILREYLSRDNPTECLYRPLYDAFMHAGYLEGQILDAVGILFAGAPMPRGLSAQEQQAYSELLNEKRVEARNEHFAVYRRIINTVESFTPSHSEWLEKMRIVVRNASR